MRFVGLDVQFVYAYNMCIWMWCVHVGACVVLLIWVHAYTYAGMYADACAYQ